ncbi:MAG TPA: dTDP-4-dehydrorhamnose reductase [Planctomycetota bacterium]|nr:dTDP-4-dehydrorhamnose reductase [Planctomycetota bacterium]
MKAPPAKVSIGRVLVTGAGGLLGRALAEAIAREAPGVELDAAARADLDVTDPAAVAERFRARRPDAVVHAAAYTDVDGAEEERETCYRVNALAAETVARRCAAARAPLAFVSSDFVFDGTKGVSYCETDEPAPLGVYARSKRWGEELVLGAHPRALVVRTAWLFGPGGENFVDKILERGQRREPFEVVDGQVGSPSYAPEVAAAIWRLLARGETGIVHCVNQGSTSWFEFARAILAAAGLDPSLVRPTTAKRLGRPAPRPACSALASTRLERAGIRMRPWREALLDHLRARVAGGRP